MSPTPRPTSAFVVALVSAVLCPILIMVEFTALFFAAMVNAEAANSTFVKALTVAIVIVIGLIALAVPIVALVLGARARAASKTMPVPRAGLATAALVIAGIVTAGVAAAQVYMILMAAGSCSLEGC